MSKSFWIAVALVLFASTAEAADATEDCPAPCFSYDLSLSLANDWIFAANPSEFKANIFEPTATLETTFTPVENLDLVTTLTEERVIDPEPGQNADFENLGVYVQEIYARLDLEPFSLKAGKFDTEFSLMSDKAPGVAASGPAEGANADERWGAEAAIAFEGPNLKHRLAAAAFTTDRTVLSESLFTNRGRKRLSEGGAGNTSGVSSFSLVYDGCLDVSPADCYEDGRFGYRIGIRHQRAGHATPDQIDEGQAPRSETGVLGATTGRFEFNDMTLRLIGEAAWYRHFEGEADDAVLLSASSALEVDQMTYSAMYAAQRTLAASGGNHTEHFVDLSAVYKSGEDVSWSLGAGYNYERNVDAEAAHTLSLELTFDLSGSHSLQ